MPATTGTTIAIDLDLLHDSPFNPRQIFDQAALDELATDIKSHGRVLQPLLVRPRTNPLFKDDPDGATGFEIVFGHRRARAARLAGLQVVDCMVRPMSEDDARRAQISENLQRKDVHPIEEAEGFQALIDAKTHTADSIAAEFGKSRSYVYGRLKLLQACPAIRQQCLEGKIGAEVALLIARLRTPKLQEKALAAIGSAYIHLDDGGSRSYRHARDLLAEKFTLGLKGAMFDTADATLLPEAGDCTTCPKRAGNAPEYADLADGRTSRHGNFIRASADSCTDPDCFDAKKKAHLAREAAKLTSGGATVVTGGAARAAISAVGEIKGGYVPLKDVKDQLAKLRTKKGTAAADAPAAPQIVLIQDPRTGKTHQAVKLDALKAAGVKVKEEAPKRSSSGYDSRDYAAERKAKEAKAAALTKGNVALFHAVRAARAENTLGLEDLRAVVASVLDDFFQEGATAPLLAAWGCKHLSDLTMLVDTGDHATLAAMLMDCTLLRGVEVSSWNVDDDDETAEILVAAAARVGIDAAAVRAGAIATPEALAA